MDLVQLGDSDLRVSRVCLGTAFRSEADEATGVAAIDRAEELGCNFLDCANIYRDGLSERIVGKAIRGRRDRFIVTTKVGSAPSDAPTRGGLRRDAIQWNVERSLSRLGTDHIDLYLCHFPDPDAPIDETLSAMDAMIRHGKVRYAGCSNFESWRVCDALHVAGRLGLTRFVCNQALYSLLNRGIEDEVLPFCRSRNVAVTAYAPTAIGLLSGRYRYGQPPPEGTSWHRGPYNYRAAMTPAADAIVKVLLDVAERYGKTPTQVAMNWCLAHGVAAVITGADTPQRVDENFGATGWSLERDDLALLDGVSESYRMVLRKDCPEGYRPDTP